MTVISELAKYFDQELQRTLPIVILPNGSLGYHNFLIKKLPSNRWGVFNVKSKELINEYYLKSCALMSAKFYNHYQFNLCHEVKDLDNKYWSHYSDNLVFKMNIENAPDEKYAILEARLSESSHKSAHYQKRISQLFKTTFR
jgi:hypothetical protein